MPRKEGPPLEERLQRAKELFEFKQLQKEKNLRELYSSRIYKFARKSSIAFLWVAQLILIDWALPYRKDSDIILNVIVDSNTIALPNKELFIKTKNGYNFIVELPKGTQKPSQGDSIIALKTFLLHDFKKLYSPALKENFLVTTAITYRFAAYLLIGLVLSSMFVFVKNIEVKMFGWIVAIFTTGAGLFFLYYIISGFL